MITTRDPRTMTEAERRQELAEILARGYVRGRTQEESQDPVNPLAEEPPAERSCGDPVHTAESVA